MPLDQEKYERPARRGDVEFLRADMILGFRQVHLALLAMRHGRFDEVDHHLAVLEQQTDGWWEQYLDAIQTEEPADD